MGPELQTAKLQAKAFGALVACRANQRFDALAACQRNAKNHCRSDGLVLVHAFALQTRVVETTGIEPVTPCLQSRCSPS
jgi:hypothetical protein